jgi:hypothetical protein
MSNPSSVPTRTGDPVSDRVLTDLKNEVQRLLSEIKSLKARIEVLERKT